jgi:hypothetical protein
MKKETTIAGYISMIKRYEKYFHFLCQSLKEQKMANSI